MTAAVGTLGAVTLLAAGFAVGGLAGVLAVVALAAAAALLAARLRVSPQPRRKRSPRLGRDPNAAFGAYRRISSALSQAQQSRRHFDYAARPLLQRLLAALLADRRRVDLGKDPQAARDALGCDLWPLLDPARPACNDTREPGIGGAALARIIDRLEDL